MQSSVLEVVEREYGEWDDASYHSWVLTFPFYFEEFDELIHDHIIPHKHMSSANI